MKTIRNDGDIEYHIALEEGPSGNKGWGRCLHAVEHPFTVYPDGEAVWCEMIRCDAKWARLWPDGWPGKR